MRPRRPRFIEHQGRSTRPMAHPMHDSQQQLLRTGESARLSAGQAARDRQAAALAGRRLRAEAARSSGWSSEACSAYGANHLVGRAGSRGRQRPAQHRVTGVFRRAAGGFGFVRPAGTGPAPTATQDIYIAADDARRRRQRRHGAGAADKEATGRRPNPRGEIVEIIERETHQFVGTYFEPDGHGLRAGRRHALRQADLRRRSRREERPARRQGRLRDGPLSHRTCTTARA